MKIRLNRDELLKAIDYHATEGYGLQPVVESDADVTDWTRYLLGKWIGTGIDGDGFGLAFDGEGVVLAGDARVIEAVRESIL